SSCEEQATETPAEEEEGASPRDYFPAHAGDRWRMKGGDSLAITTVTESGTAVFFGSDRTSAERYRVTDNEVLLVDPNDRPIARWLERPMSIGHQWSYTLGDSECDARYATIEQSAEVAGLTFEHCVEVRRQCRYPAGKPFPEATRELREETWCPYVGRVREVVRFDPPPSIEGVEAEHVQEVAYYRVEGAPAPPLPETFDCSAFLLMEGDVQAACGPRMRELERSDAGGCTARYGSPDGEITVLARRFDRDATDPDVDQILAQPASEIRVEGDLRIVDAAELPEDDPRPSPTGGIGLREGHHAIAVVASPACGVDQLRRLARLLRSVVRQ
ncbi:MAG: hypothetical protein AAGE52_41435, partial [Myxococcota bacterium]